MDKPTLLSKVDATVNQNGRGAVTGKLLNSTLKLIIEECFGNESVNLGNSDLTVTGLRTVDCDGNILRFTHAPAFNVESTGLVAAGHSTFHVTGPGTSSGTKVMTIDSDAGAMATWYANRSLRLDGYIGVGDTPISTVLFNVYSNDSSVTPIRAYNSGTGGVPTAITGYSDAVNGRGVFGSSVYGEGLLGNGVTGVYGIGNAGPGVYGTTSTGWSGVWGHNDKSDGRGVYGTASGVDGTGGLFIAKKYGAYGRATDAAGFGGYFENTDGGISLYAAETFQIGTTTLPGSPPADGVFEYDGTNLFFTTGGTRTIIV